MASDDSKGYSIIVLKGDPPLTFDFVSHLQPIYDFVESKNKGLAETPEVVAMLHDLDDLWDNLNQMTLTTDA